MPTPPLTSRDDDEHGAMPADCRVETLAEWLYHKIRRDSDADIARAVRALVEAKVREAVCDADLHDALDEAIADHIVSRVLGAP